VPAHGVPSQLFRTKRYAGLNYAILTRISGQRALDLRKCMVNPRNIGRLIKNFDSIVDKHTQAIRVLANQNAAFDLLAPGQRVETFPERTLYDGHPFDEISPFK
jgi:hypothetical protein